MNTFVDQPLPVDKRKEKRERGKWKWSEWEGMNGERKAAEGEMSERALAKRG